MTQGDNLFGIKTVYKDIEMRSKLETKFAYFLDSLNIIWVYEPKKFTLSNETTYIPDFYLPELNIWIEVKGDIKEHNRINSILFTKENHADLILISAEDVFYYDQFHGEDTNVQIGCCWRCKKHFFCSLIGDYHCRACLYYNGDEDVFAVFRKADMLNFNELSDIKRWLKENGKRC